MNNEKTLREKSMEWWDEVTESEAAVYRMQYFKTRESLTDEQVDFVYQSEHPETIKDKFQSFDGTNDHFAERETISQQTNSVVSIEGKREMAERFHKMFLHGNLSPYDIALKAADWQKEQYNSLLNSYRELFEALQKIEAHSWHKNEWQDMQTINDIARPLLPKANNILKQFNQ